MTSPPSLPNPDHRAAARAEVMQAGADIAVVANRHGIDGRVLRRWERERVALIAAAFVTAQVFLPAASTIVFPGTGVPTAPSTDVVQARGAYSACRAAIRQNTLHSMPMAGSRTKQLKRL